MRPIPLYDVKADNARWPDELRHAFERVLARGRFVAGPETAAFEQELADYVGTEHAVAVRSGTDALLLALKALGIGPGDEVITTAFTFFATVEAILLADATPVFADIEPETLCLSPDACESKITDRTKALLLVHVFGHCADMARFRALCAKHRLALMEDAAQTVGSQWQNQKLGSLGLVGTFSFYPTKNLGALGNAGAVTTSAAQLADAVRSLQNHGCSGETIPIRRTESGHVPVHTRIGWNSRMDELQAAFLRVKLAGLDSENERRRQIAARYDAELPQELRRVRGAPGCVSNFHQYAVRTEARDELRAFLAEQGIGTGDYYRIPVYREPAFLKASSLKLQASSMLQTEAACREVLTLPVRPNLTDDEQTLVIETVRRFFGPSKTH